jgi:Recombination endonuclease VII
VGKRVANTYEGKPCVKCGGTEHAVSNGQCMACKRTWQVNNLAQQSARGESKTYEGKACPKCGATKRYTRDNRCVACADIQARRWREDNPERIKEAHIEWKRNNREKIKVWVENNRSRIKTSSLKNVYGTTYKAYTEMLADQDGRCACCFRRFKSSKLTHLDHCHESGRVRELLCSRCNHTLGKVGDDPSLLRALALYLEKHKAPKAIKQAEYRERVIRQRASRQSAPV